MSLRRECLRKESIRWVQAGASDFLILQQMDEIRLYISQMDVNFRWRKTILTGSTGI